MEPNRLSTAAGEIRRDVESHLRWLEEHVERIYRELDERILSSPLAEDTCCAASRGGPC